MEVGGANVIVEKPEISHKDINVDVKSPKVDASLETQPLVVKQSKVDTNIDV